VASAHNIEGNDPHQARAAGHLVAWIAAAPS